MNILIKGLEIPENGYLDVRILNRSGLEMAAVTWNDSGCYPYAEAHNVVVLPERHGRLIDADALIEDIRKNSESYFADDFAHEWVNRQPIIVEAEGEEQ